MARNARQFAISEETLCPHFSTQHHNTMNKNPLNKGILTENASGIGTVTPEMVEARARELAVIAGRVPPQPSQVDYEQAKRELTGEPDTDVQESDWDEFHRLPFESSSREIEDPFAQSQLAN